MFPDLTLPPKEILVDAINAKNFPGILPRAITVSDVIFADPAPFGGDAANSMIVMTTANDPAVQAVLGVGSKTVYYNRVRVDQLLDTATTPLTVGSAVNVSDVLSQINTQYNLNLTAADIIDEAIDQDVEPPTATLRLKSTSLIYMGNAVLVFDSGTETVPSLSTVILTRRLPGLTPPVAPG